MIRLDEGLQMCRILAIDDEAINLLFLRRTLESAGCRHVTTESDPSQVLAVFAQREPDLVVLDLHMPGMDGFELMQRLAPIAGGRTGVPFLVLTGDENDEVRRQALNMGARDFLTKPFSPTELVLRVRNLLEVQQLHRQLRDQNTALEGLVARRTQELERARLEILNRLVLAAEYRDDATQEHAWRIGRTCRILSQAMGYDRQEAELLRRAAPLHDIGKIGISDAILLKPGRLTESEFEVMKAHTTIGSAILSGSSSRVLSLAEEIAISHHERWNGRGYPFGRRETEIPIPGRIVAIADVFDALTHERPYKRAWPLDQALSEILGQRGHHFDPEIVDVFAALDHATLLGPMQDPTGAPAPTPAPAPAPGDADPTAAQIRVPAS
jgi:putative two-component system response regulator